MRFENTASRVFSSDAWRVITSSQVAALAAAPPDWLERAFAYAGTLLHGASAAVSATGITIGQTAGYTVADYLHQYARRIRRSAGEKITIIACADEQAHEGRGNRRGAVQHLS